jgi:hypothetical protein
MKSKKEQKQRRDRQARRAAKKKCLGDQKMRFCPTLRQRGWILSSAEDEAMARGKEKPRHAKCLGWLVMGPFTRRAQGNLEDETSSSRLTGQLSLRFKPLCFIDAWVCQKLRDRLES